VFVGDSLKSAPRKRTRPLEKPNLRYSLSIAGVCRAHKENRARKGELDVVVGAGAKEIGAGMNRTKRNDSVLATEQQYSSTGPILFDAKASASISMTSGFSGISEPRHAGARILLHRGHERSGVLRQFARCSIGSITNGSRGTNLPREFIDANGHGRSRVNWTSSTVGRWSLADRVDHIVLFSARSFSTLGESVQRRGVRVPVVSTISSSRNACRELRRQGSVRDNLTDPSARRLQPKESV